MTSSVAHENKQFWSAYAASKAALEVIAKTYAHEVAKTNLKVNLIDPGPTRTRLRAVAYPAENPNDHPLPETKAQMFLDAVLSEENGVVFGG